MRRLLGTGSVLLLLALAACTTPGSDPDENADESPVEMDIESLDDTTLSVWTSESGTRLEILEKLADQFHEEYPNITVKWTVRDFAAYPAQIKLALSSDDGPDACIGNLGWALDGPLIKAGLLRPLDDYAEAYGWDERYPEIGLRQLKFSEDGTEYGEGPIWGTPYAADVIGWFYNNDMLDELGMDVPTTMDELEAVLEASKAAGQQPIILGNKDGWPIWHLLYNLIDQYTPAEEITGIVYGDEGASYEAEGIKTAMDKVVAWNDAGYLPPDVNSVAQADATADFKEGKALFFPAGSWEAADMPDNIGFFLNPPLEEGEVSKATGSFGYSFHVAANSDAVAASAAFLDWMSNENAARTFFAAGDIAPLAVEDPELKEGQVFTDIYDGWTSVLDNNVLMPYLEFATPTAPEVQYPVTQQILAGRLSVEDGLAQIEADRVAFVEENESGG
jgi:raffinose/stachyose/melibiose transport system substrate-binding protein